jgi:hypothetical protein
LATPLLPLLPSDTTPSHLHLFMFVPGFALNSRAAHHVATFSPLPLLLSTTVKLSQPTEPTAAAVAAPTAFWSAAAVAVAEAVTAAEGVAAVIEFQHEGRPHGNTTTAAPASTDTAAAAAAAAIDIRLLTT